MPIPIIGQRYRNIRQLQRWQAPRPVATQLFNRKSATFNGTNEYTKHGDVLGFEYDEPFSVCGWCKSSDSDAGLISKFDTTAFRGWAIWIETTGQLGFGFSNTNLLEDNVLSTATINDGSWHHWAVTSAGTGVGGMLLYIDSCPAAKTTTSNTLAGNTIITSTELAIAGTGLGTFLHQGLEDEIAVISRVITPAEVSMIYRARDLRLLPFAQHIQGYWSGDGSDGSVMPDYSGNGYNGTPQNMDASNFTTDVHAEPGATACGGGGGDEG